MKSFKEFVVENKTISRAKLNSMTKDQLVKYAYSIGCGEKSITSEHRGPFNKNIIIDAILAKMSTK